MTGRKIWFSTLIFVFTLLISMPADDVSAEADIVAGSKLTAAIAVQNLSDDSQDTEEKPTYRNPEAPIEDRVNDLLSRMTLEEKVAQLGGDETTMATPDNDRLGIPGFKMADGPHGVRWEKATCFPSPFALGATWDTALVQRVGQALGREFRGKGRYVALAPCINVIRDPRGGRSFETMGEDPYLIAQLAVAYVKGVQSQKVISVVKHYACNNQEDGRGTNNVIVNERTLREIYLPAFRACVQEANAWGIMSAYNKVNGPYCSENPHLLTEILKDEWGFKGFVVSDWGACHSTVESANAGLDVEMPHANYYGQPLLDAVENWQVSEKTIDKAVRRVLRAKFWAGVFEEPVKPDESVINCKEHQQLVLEAASKSIVLLKNTEALLPLDRNKVKTIAVIGPNANIARPVGGGSCYVTPYYAVSPLDGIKRKAGETTKVLFAQGCNISLEESLHPIKSSALKPLDAKPGQQGLLGEYFNNKDLSGEPTVRRIDTSVDFNWGGDRPAPAIGSDNFSVRWTGKLIPEKTGEYLLGTMTDDGVRLYLDGKLLIDDWFDHATVTRSATVRLEAGRIYDIRIEYYEHGGEAVAKLCWAEPEQTTEEPFLEAKEAAKKADVAIVVVGTTPQIETEGKDRPHLALPGQQDELIQAVFEANPKTVVVLVNGSALLMNQWIDKVPAVLECWFGGQEIGNAIADVLFGDHNPGGKLPITFPRTEDQMPPFDNNYEAAGEGRGYRYYDKHQKKPLFPFGYGLSYTTFEYKNLKISTKKSPAGNPVTVSVDVRNTGTRTGDEIVQLYVHDVKASVDRPLKELKGFKRVTLKPGQMKTVTFTLNDDALAFYNVKAKRFVVEPGVFDIMVGSSSTDYLTTSLEVMAPADS